MTERKVRIACPAGCGMQQFDPTTVLLVKAFGEEMRVVFTCPICEKSQRMTVVAPLVPAMCEVFRAAGNPLIQLPPQGDLPWPKIEYDDLLDFALSFDEEMAMLLEGGT